MLTERFFVIVDKIIFYGLIFLIVFTPFPPVFTSIFSSRIPWSLAVTVLVVLVLIALWFFKEIYRGTLTYIKTPLDIPFLAFIAIVLFQLIPLPPKILQFVSPSSASIYAITETEDFGEIYAMLTRDNQEDQNFNSLSSYSTDREQGKATGVSYDQLPQNTPVNALNYTNQINKKEQVNQKWHPITLYTYASKIQLLRLLVYFGVYFLIIHNIKTKKQVKQIVITIIVTGLSVAFLGLLQYLSGTNKIFWFYEIKKQVFFSTFLNRDHFACYVGMINQLAIGSMITEYLYLSSANSRSGIREPGWGFFNHRVLFYIFAIAIIFIPSLFLAQCSGAAFSLMISFCLLMGMIMCRKQLRKTVWIAVPFLVISFGMLVWIGIQPVIDELSTNFGDTGIANFQSRLEFWKDTLSAARDFPFWGAGVGVFPYILLCYNIESSGKFINHAHNDYLELLLETGIIGFAIVMWAMYRFIKDCALYHILGLTQGIQHEYSDKNVLRYLKYFGMKWISRSGQSNRPKPKKDDALKKRKDPFIIGTAMGGVIGVMSICIHCIVDFNTYIPANAFLVTVLLGITMVTVHMENS